MRPYKFNKCLEIIRKGNSRGLEDIYYAFYEKIKYSAYLLLKDASAAEDVASDTLKYILEKKDEIPYIKNPQSWILKVSRNLAINRIRKKSKITSLDDGSADTISTHDDNADFRLLFKDCFFKLLTEIEQKIVLWHYMCGYKYSEISRILKRPIGTIKSDISIIKAKLKHLKKFS